MTSTSLGSMPAWAIASLAAFTISDSLVSFSSLPNLLWDQPTMQAVMGNSWGNASGEGALTLIQRPRPDKAGPQENCSLQPYFRLPEGVDCSLQPEPIVSP